MQVGQKIGPFDIEKKIGSGAMGAVYLARYRKTGQRVAIKMMLMGMADNDVSLARFEREAEVLKQLNHQNIVRFYIASQFQGTPYYAMEYVEGEPLDLALERKGRLTWEEVVELGQQVCAALQHAHDQGIVHRDLKPSNLMITPDGTLKLTDFGIAKDLDVTQLTSANCTVGTAAYMSPEQCRGERNLTHKSDLYSLGVVLYELLTGRKPFEAETTMDMFLQHVQGSFERPSRNVLDIPVWLDTLVCQLLEKEPAKRPFDARTVADALGQVAEKVQAQRSAGVDVAQARIVDRSTLRNQSLDETDRQAARTILTSMRKGKRKRRGPPLQEQKWLQALGLMLALAGIAALIYVALRPPSADSLFQKAQELMASADADDWQKAREQPITDYLHYYGGRQDEQSLQVQRWADQCDLVLKGKQLENISRRGSLINETASQARMALEREAAGDLDGPNGAIRHWERCRNEAGRSSDDHAWLLFAERQLNEFQRVDVLQAALQDKIAAMREGKEYGANSFEGRAADAVLYEAPEFDDPVRARQSWSIIKESTQNWYKDMIKSLRSASEADDSRLWYLLATKNAARLEPRTKDKEEEAREKRVKLLSGLLADAEATAQKPAANVKELGFRLRTMARLYMNDEDAKVKELAHKADELVKKLSPQNLPPDSKPAGP